VFVQSLHTQGAEVKFRNITTITWKLIWIKKLQEFKFGNTSQMKLCRDNQVPLSISPL